MNALRMLFSRVMETAGDADGGGGGDAPEGAAAASQPDPAVEQRAREMGWSAKDQWRGDPSHWVDAQEFVKRGEQVMPILRANLRKSESEIATLRRQHAEAMAQIQAQNESIQVLTNLSTAASREAAKEKRRELLKQQATARSAGDTDLEIDLGEQIADVTSQINAAVAEEKKTAPKGTPAAAKPAANDGGGGDNPTTDPQYQAWVAENQWFGTDRRKTALATAIGEELRSDPANASLVGKAFFDRVTQEVNKVFSPARATNSKVEGSGNDGAAASANGGRDYVNGKSYADLPTDAKEACERQSSLLVGPGKAFKDVAAWRKHYVTVYFSS